MSSADGNGSNLPNSDELRRYFCHQCERTAFISTSSTDLICPNCNGTFLEELETPIPNPNPNPNPNPIPPFFSYTTDFPAANFSFPIGNSQPLEDLSVLFGNRSSPSPASPFGQAFNPVAFIQNYLQNIRPGAGGNVQFFIDDADDPTGPFRFPGNANPGDYFFGPGLEDLIQQLAENDPSRRGTPPASKSAVEKLPVISVTEELLESDSAQCAVCKDTFALGEKAKQMPCKHIYHTDCILPWLELHNSCPVCRYELPTDDADYEQRARGDGVGGGPGGGGVDDSQTRRFRMSLPWPFRQVPSSSSVAGTSNAGNVNNNNNNSNSNSGQSDTESRGNQSFEPETRQEDLD
ncbi:E3 ubiquitin-protein ligase RING1-like [Cicer arietinum]|uniref:RING-type E3 ubiquitin transferase n=1 Tax=Cicer arietinum TaxID=3827 RepID=A0A1S3DVM1_CICAR|nr:E3 ubiquitin-protein ligase RING1-like [Cicer arietinum]